MKRILGICMALVLVLSLSMSAFAASAFVSSPSAKPGPTVISKSDPGIKIHGFKDINSLPEEVRTLFLEAYNEISATEDLSTLIPGLEDLAKKKKTPKGKIRVGDLFNVGTDGTSGDGPYTVSLSESISGKFIGLAQRTPTGWKLIDNATFADGKLTFTFSEPGEFAVLVDTSAGTSPKTSDNNTQIFLAIFAVSAIAVLAFSNRLKKECK